MANRIRRFIESVVFAGLKPSGGVPVETKPPRRLGPLQDKIELFLSGGQSSDPLYLSNRTWKQKLRLPLLVAAPTLLLFCALALIFTNVYSPKAAPPKEVSPREVMKRLLPDLENTVHLDAHPDSEVGELRVLHDGAPRVTGFLKNKTNRLISVEIDLDFLDVNGSRVGSITERVDNAQPNASTPFEFPAGNSAAEIAFVRKIHTVR
jgi:hypothetical protein